MSARTDASRRGFRVEQGKHWKAFAGTRLVLVFSASPSCRFWRLNAKHDLRRAAR